MDESKEIHENVDHGFFHNRDDFSGFERKDGMKPQKLFDVLKFSLLKLAVDGADKVFKDPKSLKSNRLSNGLREQLCDSLSQQGENCNHWSSASQNCHDQFPFNFLAFLALLMMKLIGFQFNLLVSFFTFPIWLAYVSFMFVLFPFQTLRHICGYLMKKLLGVGWAFFSFIYVCSMLLTLLAIGFVLGGFMVRYLVENPIQTKQSLIFDYTKTSPVAFVPIMLSSISVVPYDHKLQLTVSLTVPESEYNRKLGVFQVRVEFLSADGKITGSSSYPCMLRFKSQPIRIVETILKSAPLLAGFQSESQVLNIKMNKFSEGVEPTACLKVILEQRAEYEHGGGIPQVYEASLLLESELPRLKKMIWYWRRTLFVWASIISFLTQLVFILAFCRPIIVPGWPRIGSIRKNYHVRSVALMPRDI
ncbi:hypothetical protein SLA2020_277260 [Shorea laevis]